ncbi:MAG: Calx-beta domain-containing protein, partial [Pyrinomonadaceae bacterium]
QNFPLLSSVTSDSSSTTIQGTLNSTPNTTFRIDFYSNTACDPSGNGEGAQFMGNANVTTAANGNAVINATLPVALAAGRVVTATATDPSGNTSEFSACDSSQTAGSLHFSSANYYALEDVGNLTITVVRTGGSKGAISVNYSSADSTAIAGSDYSTVSGTLLFADGETSKTFTIPVVNDGVTEPDETLRLALGGTTDLERIGSPATATVTIQDNSTPVYLVVNYPNPLDPVDVLEGDTGNTNVVVIVGLTAATGRTVTADFSTSPGSATSGVDFIPASGNLQFAPGVTQQTITFQIVGDTLNEINETVGVVLSNPTNATLFGSGSVRIINDDPLPGVSINDVSISEGNSGTTTLSFTVSLSPVSGRTVRVNYATANGTATAGSDYVSTSGLLTFNAGETSKTISVTVNGDTAVEGDETVFVDLTNPVGASITKLRGVGTITNDEVGSTTVQFSTTNFSKSEGGGSTNITVTRAGDTSGSSSVDYRTGGNSFVACDVLTGTAVQNCDFIVSAGTVNFAAGETSKTFPVLIYDDAYLEGDETLSLTLSNAVGATVGSPNPATLTITDNETSGAPPAAAKTFVATLSSSQEVPASGTSGKGGGIVQLDAGETSGKVGLVFFNLSSPQTDAHIHGPAAVGANGPIAFPLPLGTVVDHSISPTAQQVSDLKGGLNYLNVHSNNFTAGEIRGQLLWNPLNEAQYFVRQHYYDFLGRLPDQGGMDYWTNELAFCGTNVQCLRERTVGVSNAFFYEDEYQQTASYVFLLYRAAFGNNQPFPNADPANPTEGQKIPRYLSFVRDRAQVVGGSGLAASQLALANSFVQRPEFTAKYPSSLATGAQFVDAVLTTIQTADGATLAAADRSALITHFNNGGRGLVMFHLANDYWNGCSRLPGSPPAPCVPAGYGAAVDNRTFIDAEYNRSFVYSQYSGYLRRDADINGFIFWLNQVSTAPPRNVAKQHGMVCAFITSAEYQLRFGSQTPRTNAECVP